MDKLVIANRGTASIGKSSAVKAVYQLLKDRGYRLIKEEWQGMDIKAIFEIQGVKVGVESQGDPGSLMEFAMNGFVEIGCDIIVTSCRTKWATYEKVTRYLGELNGYDILWAAHYVYQVPGADATRDILNARYAQQVYQLISERIRGIV